MLHQSREIQETFVLNPVPLRSRLRRARREPPAGAIREPPPVGSVPSNSPPLTWGSPRPFVGRIPKANSVHIGSEVDFAHLVVRPHLEAEEPWSGANRTPGTHQISYRHFCGFVPSSHSAMASTLYCASPDAIPIASETTACARTVRWLKRV